MKTKMKRKINYSVISAFGFLLLLIGYGYMMYSLSNINKEIKFKQTQLISLADSLNVTEEKLQLNKELIAKIDERIKASNNERLINEVNKDIRINKTIEKSLSAKLNPVTMNKKVIYIQVNDVEVLNKLKKLDFINVLSKSGYTAYDYDLEVGKADNTIRYFHKEDAKIADSLNVFLSNNFSIKLTPTLIRGYEKKVPQELIELWIK